MNPEERAMSEPADPWEGVPDSWRDALRSYACAEATMPEWREARITFAALLREAAADSARLDWLEAHPHGCVLRQRDGWVVTDVDRHANNHRGGSVREAIDAALSSGSAAPLISGE